MNSPKVFTLSQLLPWLGARTKTIGARGALMTEALARHLSQDVEHLGQHQLRRVARPRFSVWTIDVPKTPTLCSLCVPKTLNPSVMVMKSAQDGT